MGEKEAVKSERIDKDAAKKEEERIRRERESIEELTGGAPAHEEENRE